MDDFSGYQDDFFEGDGGNNDGDFEDERISGPSRNQQDDDDDNDGDEQFAQKVNGKLERLQQRIFELEQDLETERKNSLDLKRSYEEQVDTLLREQASSKQSGNELQKLKNKYDALQEKYEMSLLTRSNTSSTFSLPPAVEQELQAFCEKHRIFPDCQRNSISPDQAITILRTLIPKKARDARGGNGGGGDGGGDGTSAAEQVLQKKLRNLEESLKDATATTLDDVQSLKNKIFHLSERVRVEKEYKRTAENEVATSKKKIAMLSDHMEKLVLHLKRESAHKLRLSEQLRQIEKENSKTKERCELVTKKLSIKDRLLFEMREGSKVLEDQLRLMDEKYLELRGKLDWARAAAARKIKRAEKTASDLRVKFAMSGASMLLDNVSLPEGWNTEHDHFGSNGSLGGSIQPSPLGMVRGLTPLSRAQMSRSAVTRSGESVQSMAGRSLGSQRSEPTLDNVLEKIRLQQGAKQEWTDEKLKKLVQSR